MMTCHRNIDQRKRDLASIHIAKKQLGMDDGTYRDMLYTVARVRSASELDRQGREDVIKHLKAIGFKRGKKDKTAGRPHNINSSNNGPLLKKIEALLADAGRPWSYAQSMARRMFHVDQLAFCSPQQLHSIVAALEIDKRRHSNNVQSD